MPVWVRQNITTINLKPDHRGFVLKVLKFAPVADFHTLLLVVKNISKKRTIAKNEKQYI
jgi:hypothetical protein